MSLFNNIRRYFFPVTEIKRCVVTPSININWRWTPAQLIYKNGVPLDEYNYLTMIIIPIRNNTEEAANEIAKSFNLISEKYENILNNKLHV